MALGRWIRAKSLLIMAVLALAGLLASWPLPQAPATLAEVMGFRESVGPWIVRGSMSPRGVEGFDLEMSVLDADGAPPAGQVDVMVTLAMQDHAMPAVEVRATSMGRSAYRAIVPLPMAGRWEMTIRLREGQARVPIRATAGVAAGGWSGGSLLDRQNPIPATVDSIARGEQVYRAHCQACHGPIGAGDGPLAATLRPRPADLRVHVAAGHSDGQFFYWIAEGLAGTGMPPFRGRLSEEDRWHVLNFIRTLAPTDR
jgi:mono/diheme cytochrome c family protein